MLLGPKGFHVQCLKLFPLQPAGCIIFTPFFSAVYNQEQLILQTIYVHKQGELGLNSAVYNQERFQIKSGLLWRAYGN